MKAPALSSVFSWNEKIFSLSAQHRGAAQPLPGCRASGLQNNADQTAGALVDDALKGLPQLGPGVVRHPLDLGVQILVHQLVEGFAEDVGLPDAAGVPLVLLEQIVDHVLALLLAPHDGGHLGLNIRPDHVYCLEQTEVFPRPRRMINFSSSESTFR